MFLCQLTACTGLLYLYYLDPNGAEGDSLPENGRAEDSVTGERSICDDKHNSEDEEESGRPRLP
jgi:hypothetical protein